MYKKIYRYMSFISIFTLVLTALVVYFACIGVKGRSIESEIKDLSEYITENYEAIDKDSFFSEKNITVFDKSGNLIETFGNKSLEPVSDSEMLILKAIETGSASGNENSLFEAEGRCSYFKHMGDGKVIAVTEKIYGTGSTFARIIIPTLLISLLIYALSSIISARLTENIVEPSERINPLDD